MIDLHTHSTASDGSYTPRGLINLAESRGVTLIALTDHDTVAGIEAACDQARKNGIAFLPGIELEAESEQGVLHVLGLGVKTRDAAFHSLLKDIQEKRRNRNLKIIAAMQRDGIPSSLAEVQALRSEENQRKGAAPCVTTPLGRPHFAAYLVAKGKAGSIQSAFQKYLIPGKAFYAAREKSPLKDIVRIIHSAEGYAVIAHPATLHYSWYQLQQQLPKWKAAGIQGIEAFHPGLGYIQCRRMAYMAKQHGFFVTAGSDFHGEYQLERFLGLTTKSRHRISEHYMPDILRSRVI